MERGMNDVDRYGISFDLVVEPSLSRPLTPVQV
jgi:hypothetical protein